MTPSLPLAKTPPLQVPKGPGARADEAFATDVGGFGLSHGIWMHRVVLQVLSCIMAVRWR
ncbi:MAG: hypothetical protein HC925_02415 [Coleofasciculaceae cyanobacterium SM2_3_26]|nr:hypothetical protein [Coleofasciculaceae cyanobacterium SM2_3_26]